MVDMPFGAAPISLPESEIQQKPMIDVPMSEEQFATASKRFANNGIELTGNSGTLTKDGITAKYDYADGHLKIEVLDRPFFLPLSMIEQRLEHYLEQSLASPAREV